MQESTFTLMGNEGTRVHVYCWLPDPDEHIQGVVQIAHGMGETAARYAEFAGYLTKHGFAVYANDHRGHGRTVESTEALGDAGVDAFRWMAKDMVNLGELVAKEHPDVPLFLMGHSMGSFLVQHLMYAGHERYHAFVLSGTNGKRGLLRFGEKLALLQCGIQGDNHRSLLLNAIVFGGFNRAFRPATTPFDWLSRDRQEVQRFIDDPMCGAICTAGFFRDFFKLLLEIHLPQHMERIPKHKPVLLFSGELDPVGLRGKGVLNLYSQYQKLGLQDVEYHLYPGGRHEMLHETNRNEVAHDVLSWLKRHMPTIEQQHTQNSSQQDADTVPSFEIQSNQTALM
ncbi:Lysophospholipase, alpha-beta hydrolase superfamily [Paenibacillus polysaccharolyticus]|uniref:Lysophospholipase, alpha-beta hydrolase superfamily n=2 Tax=Paenibacillus TaxID=44249 RepID=A0A1G5JPT8_9BACL|nr:MULTISPECIES: alpha/beta fold hydrolase [Paenibacillus]MBY0202245.1 lysophospholipase [Paenibacillus cucumis (ex Kampfer et al. 2016)]MDP9701374.1 alpha-beta hydrolase superfamily lysophospholipase [Paenibacillus intestini]SCY89921.1 Lysophospholipase, alpha-beta hydrolase superfamily [Paenibacillus polysaccharolyticus]